MVAKPGEPPAGAAGPDGREPGPRRSTAGKRRRRGRESPLVWWAAFGVLLAAAALLRSWRLALLALLLWCLYEFVLVPTICRVMTRQGYYCREPVRGRLFGCTRKHQDVKNDALWRLAGMRNPLRTRPVADPSRETGVVVYSAQVRARLAQADRVVLLLAGLGTLVTIAGSFYGL